MAFMGETVDIGVAELLSVLARRRHAGRLSISVEGNEVQLFLSDGKVILVSSTHHGLRLGRVLVRLRVLAEERLEQAVREQDRAGRGRPLGQILLERGWVTPDDLAKAAEEQAIEALANVMVAPHGTFMFSRDTKPTAKHGLVSLNAEGIVLESSRRADEMATLRTILPPPGARLTLANRAQPAPGEPLTEIEVKVITALQRGTSTLPELVEHVPAAEVALWRTVIALRERGILLARMGNAAPESPARPDEVVARTVEEVLTLTSSAGTGQPGTRVPTLAEVRAGKPAGAQTVAQVTGVVREVIAAFNAGMTLRAFAHFTDDHFKRQERLPASTVRALRASPKPLQPESQETFLSVLDARVLSDQRVSAILVTRTPGIGDTRKVLILAWGGDRWQIDAVIEAPTQAAPTQPPTTTTMLTSANLPELAGKTR